MAAGYTEIWNGEKIKRTMRDKMKPFLENVGTLYQNQMVDSAPYDTGLLKNSITYVLDSGEKGPLGNGGGARANDSMRPDKPVTPNTVRIGSGLVYAAATEYRFSKTSGWMSRAIDIIQRGGSIAGAARRWFGI